MRIMVGSQKELVKKVTEKMEQTHECDVKWNQQEKRVRLCQEYQNGRIGTIEVALGYESDTEAKFGEGKAKTIIIV